MKMMEEPSYQFSSDDDSAPDSDEELQEAFVRGELKPGLVVLKKSGQEAKEKPLVINNVPVLELKLQQIKLPKKFNWAERLDIVNGLAPLAPEIALQLDEHKTKREREIKHVNALKAKKKAAAGPVTMMSVEEDPVHNDFVREMNFYRQAQEAVLKCLPRLRELGIPTRRPDDYFAEMAKSDTHMQKVAKVLHKQQLITERAEKVRKVRQQKKIAKQTQVHVLQERQKAKKELMENVKKYRKGQKNSLDFLDSKDSGRGKGNKSNNNKPMISRKRQMKNERYGYGGKKKGSKWNTRESLDSFDDGGKKKGKGFGKGGRGPRMPGNRGGGAGGRMQGNRGGGAGGGQKHRPGKKTRQKIKAKQN